MKYSTTINAETISLEVTGAGCDTSVSLAGCPISVDLSLVTPPSLYSLIIDGRSFEAFVEESEPGEYRIVIGGEPYEVAVVSERDARSGRSPHRPPAHSGEAVVKAPMPGLVIAVTVSVGDVVSAGQGLVQLEAMKMENELLAPTGGTVRAVHVTKGQKVNVGQSLITIGP